MAPTNTPVRGHPGAAVGPRWAGFFCFIEIHRDSSRFVQVCQSAAGRGGNEETPACKPPQAKCSKVWFGLEGCVGPANEGFSRGEIRRNVSGRGEM